MEIRTKRLSIVEIRRQRDLRAAKIQKIKIIVFIILAVLALVLLYYYGVHVPRQEKALDAASREAEKKLEAVRQQIKQEKLKREQEDKERAARESEEKQEMEYQKEKFFTRCLDAANADYEIRKGNSCKELGQGSDCSLPTKILNMLFDEQERQTKECYRLSGKE